MTELLELGWWWVDLWSSLYYSLPKVAQEAPIWALGWMLASLFLFGIVESVDARLGGSLEDNETFTGIGAVVCIGPAIVTVCTVLIGLTLFLSPLLLVFIAVYSLFSFALFIYGPYGDAEFWMRYRELPRKDRLVMLALIPLVVFLSRSFAKSVSEIEGALAEEKNGK